MSRQGTSLARRTTWASHDRELLNNTATRVVTVELGAAGNTVWTHPGGFATYHDARRARFEQLVAEKKKQDAARAHMQSFVDRFRAKASKAR